MAERAGGSTSLRGLRERMVAAAHALAEERRNQSGLCSLPSQSSNIRSTFRPVIDGSVLKNDVKQRLAKERREEKKRQQEANKETQILEKERKTRIQYERQMEEKQRKLKEQKEKDEQRRISAEEKRKQKLQEERERFKAVLYRTLERSSRVDCHQKRWSWEGSTAVNSETKTVNKDSVSTEKLEQRASGLHKQMSLSSAGLQNSIAKKKTEKKRSSSLTRRSGKLQASAETDHVEEKPGTRSTLVQNINVPLCSQSSDELKSNVVLHKSSVVVPSEVVPPQEKEAALCEVSAESSPKPKVEAAPEAKAEVAPQAKAEVAPNVNVEGAATVSVEAAPEVNVKAAPAPKVNIEATSKVNMEGSPKGSMEASCETEVEALLESMETSPEVSVDMSPEVSVDPSPTVSVDPSPSVSVDVSPEVSVDVSPEVSVDSSPEVSMDASPDVSMEASSEASVEASPKTSVGVSPEASVEASPEASVEASPEASVEASPEASVKVFPKESAEASPKASPEVSPETSSKVKVRDSAKKSEMDKQASNPTAKKRPSSHIPCYKWPSSPASTWRPPSPISANRQLQKNRPPSPSPVMSKLSHSSLSCKIIPVQRSLFAQNALGTLGKKREGMPKPSNNSEAVSHKQMVYEESGNKSTPGTMNAEEATKILAEKRRLAREQREKEERQQKETEQSKLKDMAEKAIEGQQEEFLKLEDGQQQKEIKKKEYPDPEDRKVLLQKGDAKIKAQEEADKRKKEQERIMLQNLQERLERKKRIEEIMKRTRKTDSNTSKAAETFVDNTYEEDEADDEDESESDDGSSDDPHPSAFINGMDSSTKLKTHFKNMKKNTPKLVFLDATSGQVHRETKTFFNDDMKTFRQKSAKDPLAQAKGTRSSTKRMTSRAAKTRKICKLRTAQKRIDHLLWISTSSPISPSLSASNLNLAKKMIIKKRENIRQTP
ncbi:MAP7 domain-containing protein 3 isoform X8 [Canis lupus familiaris]|uniref:MAP7 domain containing 3 n=2 Tax=Canis lupus familiaris TaxID=9615 RepID=A0A8I3SBV8_CANLF|nr:MAP7 domain-containing protein 3 isoform X8 [Canis lupus familiaris]XP_038306903.1 MAP7 domain-containing protein 3 isoform X8 [Canis lupus familiaris]|eukprot:XP_022271398.1 MAP7 domain-containing protein 3 isoform X10 [Canis lupus familiaris]